MNNVVKTLAVVDSFYVDRADPAWPRNSAPFLPLPPNLP
jgi:hypothetical protein